MEGLLALLALVAYFYMKGLAEKSRGQRTLPPPPVKPATAPPSAVKPPQPTPPQPASPKPVPAPAKPVPAPTPPKVDTAPAPKPVATAPAPAPKPAPATQAEKPVVPDPAPAPKSAPPAKAEKTAAAEGGPRFPRSQPYKLPVLPENFNQETVFTTKDTPPLNLTLNPFHLTCTCPDQKAKGKLGERDARRVCAHLLAQLKKIKALEHFDPLARAVVTSRTPWTSPCASRIKMRGGDALVGFTPGENEVVVFAPERKEGEDEPVYNRFRLNILTGKWQGGRAPAQNTDELTEKVQAIFR